MSHALAPYWAVKHRRPSDYSFFKSLQPPVVKIMDGGKPDYEWVYANLPQSTVVMRDWLIDDNHGQVWEASLRDPVGTGKRVAQQIVEKAKGYGLKPERTLLMGYVNEPKVWEPGGINAAVNGTVAFCDELLRLGWRGLVLNLSVGWPANTDTATVKDTPPNWTPYAPVEAAIKRGNHVLGLHEYWGETGIDKGWGWLAGRALKCPWNVPIIIGECGMSFAVTRSGIPTAEQGWQRHISDETYANQIVEYHNRMVADSRILGLCLFLCDYASPEWWSKDVEPAYDNILARKGQLKPRATTPPVTPPKPVDPPPVIPAPNPKADARYPLDTLRVTQIYGVNKASYAKFGLQGHNGVDYGCVVGTPVKAMADGTVAWVDDDPSYGLYIRVYHKQLDCYSFVAHLSKQNVKKGDTVSLGQTIGLSGNTGNSTGPHLHFEIRLCNDAGVYAGGNAGMGKSTVDPVGFVEGVLRG